MPWDETPSNRPHRRDGSRALLLAVVGGVLLTLVVFSLMMGRIFPPGW